MMCQKILHLPELGEVEVSLPLGIISVIVINPESKMNDAISHCDFDKKLAIDSLLSLRGSNNV